MTGPVISLSLLFWQWEEPDVRIPTWAYVVAISMCLLIAFFLAWRDQYRRASELEKLIEPNIIGMVVHLHILRHPQMGNIVGVYAALKNTGADSIADSFTVTHLLNGIETTGRLLLPETDLKLGDGTVLKKSDDLQRKTIEQPIARGAQRRGVIFASFQGKYEDLLRPESKFTVTFLDCLGKKVSFSSGDKLEIRQLDMKTTLPGTDSTFGGGKPNKKKKK